MEQLFQLLLLLLTGGGQGGLLGGGSNTFVGAADPGGGFNPATNQDDPGPLQGFLGGGGSTGGQEQYLINTFGTGVQTGPGGIRPRLESCGVPNFDTISLTLPLGTYGMTPQQAIFGCGGPFGPGGFQPGGTFPGNTLGGSIAPGGGQQNPGINGTLAGMGGGNSLFPSTSFPQNHTVPQIIAEILGLPNAGVLGPNQTMATPGINGAPGGGVAGTIAAAIAAANKSKKKPSTKLRYGPTTCCKPKKRKCGC